MIRLWQLLIHGCWHRWSVTAEGTFTSDLGEWGPVIYCRCDKCGRHTRFLHASVRDMKGGA